ncbi:MAG TPA: hypothetical protein VGD67_21345 [Pseudonocardiaceae bacterium]
MAAIPALRNLAAALEELNIHVASVTTTAALSISRVDSWSNARSDGQVFYTCALAADSSVG